MSDDLLGFERFEQHDAWRCWGRVDGGVDGDSEDADLDPRTFVSERHLDKWLMTSDGRLLMVGDFQRDLVPRAGGLVRHAAGRGFAGLGAELLRQTGTFKRRAVGEALVGTSTPSQRAGRDALDVHLDVEGVHTVLGVDAETGVWTYYSGPDLTITVDRLEAEPQDLAPSFALLDLVPDVDLSSRERVSPALEGVLGAVQAASGLQVEVLDQDDETGTFRFVLLDTDNRPVGLVSRQRTEQVRPPNLFGGLWSCGADEDWTYLVNREGPDNEPDYHWAHGIRTVIQL